MALPDFEGGKWYCWDSDWCLECCAAVVAATSHKCHLRTVPLSPEMGKSLPTLHHEPGVAQQFDGFACLCHKEQVDRVELEKVASGRKGRLRIFQSVL